MKKALSRVAVLSPMPSVFLQKYLLNMASTSKAPHFVVFTDSVEYWRVEDVGGRRFLSPNLEVHADPAIAYLSQAKDLRLYSRFFDFCADFQISQALILRLDVPEFLLAELRVRGAKGPRTVANIFGTHDSQTSAARSRTIESLLSEPSFAGLVVHTISGSEDGNAPQFAEAIQGHPEKVLFTMDPLYDEPENYQGPPASSESSTKKTKPR